jgi:3-oxo-5alpha-steroid 4-dehydrogenase
MGPIGSHERADCTCAPRLRCATLTPCASSPRATLREQGGDAQHAMRGDANDPNEWTEPMFDTAIEPPLKLTDASPAAQWDEVTDVAIIGFGGAGAAAAIEARDRGADTLIIERFSGGGATRMSGGIYYAGGGTDLQKAAGYHDTPEELFRYLSCETDGEAVSPEVLRAFCDASVDTFDWLRAAGVQFPEQGFAPIKTSYPSNETTLYYSGNEKSPPYSDRATPAPRGHRPVGKGLTGKQLFEGLRQRATRGGARVLYLTRATRLITDGAGDVIGVEISQLSTSRWVRWLHRLLYLCASYLGATSSTVLSAARRALEAVEARHATRRRVHARGGVVLASGGFIFNTAWTRKHIPKYARTMRLGTVGDDGAGIALGLSAGAATRKLDRGTAWMFINPPAGLAKGLLIDRTGVRVCNEELYGAALGERIAEYHAGRAILVLDRTAWEEARNQIVRERKATFQSLFGLINLYVNNRSAGSLMELERKLGFASGALEDAVRAYNDGAIHGKDVQGKSHEYLQPLDTPPFYAVDCDIDNQLFLRPSISLGGLDVEGLSAAVLRPDGTPIDGLYAAGRTAVGVCSQHYVSGLSIADCVFAGRNAGRSAAERASARTEAP